MARHKKFSANIVEYAQRVEDCKELPKAIVLETEFSYYDEDGIFHTWPCNKLIRVPLSIQNLVERGAPYLAIETDKSPVEFAPVIEEN